MVSSARDENCLCTSLFTTNSHCTNSADVSCKLTRHRNCLVTQPLTSLRTHQELLFSAMNLDRVYNFLLILKGFASLRCVLPQFVIAWLNLCHTCIFLWSVIIEALKFTSCSVLTHIQLSLPGKYPYISKLTPKKFYRLSSITPA